MQNSSRHISAPASFFMVLTLKQHDQPLSSRPSVLKIHEVGHKAACVMVDDKDKFILCTSSTWLASLGQYMAS